MDRIAKNGSLYLVTGCDKASSWGIASFSIPSSVGTVALRLAANEVAEGSSACSYVWQQYGPAAAHTGPRRRAGERVTQNQCPFIRGFKIMVRNGPKPFLKEPANATLITDFESSDIFGTRKYGVSHYKDSRFDFDGHSVGDFSSHAGESLQFSADPRAMNRDASVEMMPSTSEVRIIIQHPLLTHLNISLTIHPISSTSSFLTMFVLETLFLVFNISVIFRWRMQESQLRMMIFGAPS
jgi:hypothetical protein